MPTQLGSKAHFHWREGEIFESGKFLFESLPDEARPKWAANILRLVVERTGSKSHAIENILNLVDRPNDWDQAHDAFDQLRDETLKLERRKARSLSEDLLLNQTLLAELVAKVTYNATHPDGPFDEDSGWSIAPCLKAVLDQLDDDKFSKVMLSALTHYNRPADE